MIHIDLEDGQTIYAKDRQGNWFRHTANTLDYWHFSSEKQIATRYEEEFGRGVPQYAAYMADMGHVRGFHGSFRQLAEFLMSSPKVDRNTIIWDKHREDYLSICLTDYATAEELSFDLWKLPVEYEGHLILFTTQGDAWTPDIRLS